MEDNNSENILILKMLDKKAYKRVYHYISTGAIEKIKTPQGIGVDAEKLQQLLETENRGTKTKKKGYAIDLSVSSKINCLYRRLATMNKYNKDNCQKDNRLTRYVDQDNYMCINLKEYLKPQIKLIAKKLEIKEYKVFDAIYDLVHKLYLEEKGE